MATKASFLLLLIAVISARAELEFCKYGRSLVAVHAFTKKLGNGDLVSQRDNVILSNTSFALGPKGEENGSIQFLGQPNSYLEISKLKQYDARKSLSLVFHVYPEKPFGPILHYNARGSGVQIWAKEGTRKDCSSLIVRFNRRDLRYTRAIEIEALTLKKWNFIAVTYNYEQGVATVFKDGEQLISKNIGKSELATQFEVRLGAVTYFNEPFKGRLYCLQFYSESLGKEEIQRARMACSTATSLALLTASIEYRGRDVEVNDKIIIRMAMNYSSSFTKQIDLGDKTPPLQTTYSSLSHSYKSYGKFLINISYWSLCPDEKRHTSISVTIQKPVGILSNVIVDSLITSTGDREVFQAKVLGGIDYFCNWNFGDGSFLISMYNGSDFTKVFKRFTKPGEFRASVLCKNRLSSYHTNFMVIVMDRITGLQIEDIEPKRIDRKFFVKWHWVRGSKITFIVYLDHLICKHDIDQERNTGLVMVDPVAENLAKGTHSLLVTAKNLVTDQLSVNKTFQLLIPVVPFTIKLLSPQLFIEVNDTIELAYGEENAYAGSDPLFLIYFDDGKSNETTLGYISHQYKVFGNFHIMIVAKNPVSQAEFTLSLKVHKPVLEIKIESMLVIPSALGNQSTLHLILRQGSDLSCEIDWGDGKQGLPDWPTLSDYGTETENFSKYYGVRLKESHQYYATGFYHVVLQCSNRLSRARGSADAIVERRICWLQIPDVVFLRFGGESGISWSTNNASNVHTNITWISNNETMLSFQSMSTSFDVTRDMYKESGTYNFEVCVWNNVSGPFRQLGTFFIEHAVHGLEVSLHDNQERIITKNRSVEVNQTIILSIHLKSGTHPKYLVNFDNGKLFETFNSKISHRFALYGQFNISVTGYNNVSRLTTFYQILVMKPVITLNGLTLLTEPTNVTKKSTLRINLKRGSDFQCVVRVNNNLIVVTETLYSDYFSKGKVKDMLQFENIQLTFTHKFMQVGNYTVIGRCCNRLSCLESKTMLLVQQPIVNLHVDMIPSLKLHKNFSVTIRIEKGTNVSYSLEFLSTSYQPQSRSRNMAVFLLQAQKVGVHSVVITAKNMVSRSKIIVRGVIIEQEIVDYKVNVCCSRSVEFNQTLVFTVETSYKGNLLFNYMFNMGYKGFTTRSRIIHITFDNENLFYVQRASVNITITISAENNVSAKAYKIKLELLKPQIKLTDLKLRSSLLATGVPYNVTASLATGSDFRCKWEFPEGSFNEVSYAGYENYKDAAPTSIHFRNILLRHLIVIKREGKLSIYLTCWNRISSVQAQIKVRSQQAITGFSIYQPTVQPLGRSIRVFWRIMGSDIKYTATLNKRFLHESSFQNGRTSIMVKSHFLPSEGVYLFSLIAENEISGKVCNTVNISVVQMLQEFQIQLISRGRTRELYYNFNQTSVIPSMANKYALEGTYLPLEFPTSFEFMTKLGPLTSIRWIVKNESNKIIYDTVQTSFSLKFNSKGKYIVYFEMANALSLLEVEMKLSVIVSIGNVTISTNGPKLETKNMTITIDFENTGDRSCFVLHFGDGNFFIFYTTNADCNKTKTENSWRIPNGQKHKLSLLHAYDLASKYKLIIDGSNEVSMQRASANAMVKIGRCQYPTATFKNAGKTPFLATRIKRARPILVVTSVTLDCELTSKAKYKWEIYKINKETAKVSLVPLKFEDATFDPMAEKDLSLRRRTLQYGLYQLRFTVGMDHPRTQRYQFTARGFIEIDKSELEVSVKGGALIRRAFGLKINFDGSVSYDPDEGKHKFEGMQFTWFCFNANEKLNASIFGSNQPPDYSFAILTKKPSKREFMGKGGCYRDGNIVITQGNNNMTLETAKMIEDQVYVILFLVQKDTRSKYGFQILELAKGEPPTLGIECVENCLEKINPSGKLSLMGTCTGEGCIGNIIYTWDIYQSNGLDKNGKIIWMRDKKANDRTEMYRHALVFVIKRGILIADRLYRFVLKGGRVGGAEGLAMKASLVNSPPRGGSCTVDMMEGFALDTVFTFWCQKWDDEDFPLSYEIVHLNEENGESPIYFGIDEKVKSSLPLGIEKSNFSLSIVIKVIDAFKATAVVNLTVQVVEPLLSEYEMVSKLENLTSGEESHLEKLFASGEYKEASQMMSAASSILNKQSLKQKERREAKEQLLKDLGVKSVFVDNGTAVLNSGIQLYRNGTMSQNSIQPDFVPKKMKLTYQGLNTARSRRTLDHDLTSHSSFENKNRSDTQLHDNETINISNLSTNSTLLCQNASEKLQNNTSFASNNTLTELNSTCSNLRVHLLNFTEEKEEIRMKRKRERLRANLISILSSIRVDSLDAVRQIGDLLASLSNSRDEVDPGSQKKSAGYLQSMASTMSDSLKGEDKAGSDDLEASASGVVSGLANIMGSASATAEVKIVAKTTPRPTEGPTTSFLMGFEMMFMEPKEEIIRNEEDEDKNKAALKEMAKETVGVVFQAAGAVASAIGTTKLPGEEPSVINSPSLALATARKDPSNKDDSPICSKDGSGFKIPKTTSLFGDEDNNTAEEPFDQQMMGIKDNPFSWDPDGGVTGQVTSLSIGKKGQNVPIKNLSEPIEIFIPRESVSETLSMFEMMPYKRKWNYHKVEMEESGSSFTAIVHPQNVSDVIMAYIKKGLRPTTRDYDWIFRIPKEGTNSSYDKCNPPSPDENYTIFLSNKWISRGTYYIGLTYLAPPSIVKNESQHINMTVDYTLLIYKSQCKYWDDLSNSWKTDGCEVGPKTNLMRTHCLCSHLTSFGGGLITAPNPIDFSKVFAGFKDMFSSGNVIVFFFIVSLFLLYIVLAIYSRRKDVRDYKLLGATPIPNTQDPSARYQYEITFYTGRGSNCGTTAHVTCIVTGERGSTGPCHLADYKRKPFQSGGINSFILFVPRCLGTIKHVRIWHDNYGHYPNWYVERVALRDCQTRHCQFFICEKWLAVDEDDGKIDRILTTASEDDLVQFKVLFKEKLARDLGDNHLWFSIFLRPPRSRFTRLQRLSSCLSTFCCTMVASAMFFGAGPKDPNEDINAIKIGPITLSIKMIIIGIEASFVVLPVNVLIVYLFRNAKDKNAVDPLAAPLDNEQLLSSEEDSKYAHIEISKEENDQETVILEHVVIEDDHNFEKVKLLSDCTKTENQVEEIVNVQNQDSMDLGIVLPNVTKSEWEFNSVAFDQERSCIVATKGNEKQAGEEKSEESKVNSLLLKDENLVERELKLSPYIDTVSFKQDYLVKPSEAEHRFNSDEYLGKDNLSENEAGIDNESWDCDEMLLGRASAQLIEEKIDELIKQQEESFYHCYSDGDDLYAEEIRMTSLNCEGEKNGQISAKGKKPNNLLLFTQFLEERRKGKAKERMNRQKKEKKSPKENKKDETTCCGLRKRKKPTEEEIVKQKKREEEKRHKEIYGSLPHWSTYIAWFLCFLTSVTSALFTLFYSMMWGKEKSNEWFLTMILSFVQDTFISQPIKVIAIAWFFATVIKRPANQDDIDADGTGVSLGDDEEALHEVDPEPNNEAEKEVIAEPPDPELLEEVRRQRLKEKEMGVLLREVSFFILFLLLLMLVSAGNRDIRAFSLYKQIRKPILEGYQKSMSLSTITTPADFWSWMNGTVIPSLYEKDWYNGDKKPNHTGFDFLRENRKLGISRIRQIRVKKGNCNIDKMFQSLIHECNEGYSLLNEDTRVFSPGWRKPRARRGSLLKKKRIHSPWAYATGLEARNIVPIWGYFNTFPGAGYLAEFGNSPTYSQALMTYLWGNTWLDKYTRAVFVEFTLYNPGTNLLAVVSICNEFPKFGGIFSRAEIYISRLYRTLNGAHMVFLAFDIVFFTAVVYSMYREGKKLKTLKKEYFKETGNIINFIFICLGLSVLVTYTIRSLSLDAKIKEFEENKDLYISFYQNAMYHETVCILMALIDFLAIAKFLTFMKFNRNFILLTETLSRSAPKVLQFFIFFGVHAIAYSSAGYLLFSAEVENFSSMINTLYTLLGLLLGNFNFEDFKSKPFIGEAFFVMYVVMMTILIMNVFLTIIVETLKTVQEDEELRKFEYNIVGYLMQQLKITLGIAKPSPAFTQKRAKLEIEKRRKWRRKTIKPNKKKRDLLMNIEKQAHEKVRKAKDFLFEEYTDDLLADWDYVSVLLKLKLFQKRPEEEQQKRNIDSAVVSRRNAPLRQSRVLRMKELYENIAKGSASGRANELKSRIDRHSTVECPSFLTEDNRGMPTDLFTD